MNCDDWRARGQAAPSDLAEIAASGAPIIGYAGALGFWFDFDLLGFAARSRPGWNFVLIGPIYCDKAAEAVSQLPGNVHHLGLKHHSELPSYVEHFSAAIVPFVLIEGTLASNPIKVFEYAALEIPIVSTDLPECRRYEVVHVAGSPEEFVACLEKAVVERNDPKSKQKLREFALNNDWDARVESILQHLGMSAPHSEQSEDL